VSILIDENTKVVVQGITVPRARSTRARCWSMEPGRGRSHAGKAGQEVEGVPSSTRQGCSAATVPTRSHIRAPAFAADAVMEAAEAGLGWSSV